MEGVSQISEFGKILIFLITGILAVGFAFFVSRLISPNNPNPEKLTSYECGEEPTGSAWINFNIRFYLVALVFVVFDVELAFMYPVVAVYKDWLQSGRGLFALTEMLLFIAVLAIGLVYVWVKRDLEWVKQLPAEQPDDLSKAA